MRFVFILMFLLLPGAAFADVALSPFYSRNLSPVVNVFGLPAVERGALVPEGVVEGRLVLEAANNFTVNASDREAIVLDGETYRNILAARWGVGKRMELGVDLPVVFHDGGVFDGFIENWHETFDLPGGGRGGAVEDRLLYAYSRSGEERLAIREETGGLGDVSLKLGWQLHSQEMEGRESALSLRASLKLPTGDSDSLRGSGATDAALHLNWERQQRRHAFFASFGGLYLGEGDVLPELQEDWVAFGSLGAAWKAFSSLALKIQLDGHTPFYKRTDLRELGDPSIQLLLGGTLALPGETMLDLGVSEDIAVDTAPDVVFHLALLRRF